MCFEERDEAHTMIKQSEDLNYKRGHIQWTLKLLTNNPKYTRFYNPKMELQCIDIKKKKRNPHANTAKETQIKPYLGTFSGCVIFVEIEL